MWVFGYGSLVWKVDFPYEKRVPGYVKGFVRRFWQGSIDHRGTPDSPGRVVTLVPYETWRDKFRDSDPHDHSPVDTCWGVAYKIPASEAERVKAHLDHREKNGYQTFEADVYHPQTGDDVPLVKGALVYVATTDNESFLGPVDLMEMAAQIANTRGPSGWNAHYLLGLCHAMRILAPRSPDPHLVSLESAVLEAQQIQCSSSADSPILSTDAVRKEDLDQLKELLEVDVRALVLAEKTIQGALATPDSSSSCEVYGGRRVEVSAQRLQVIDDADTPHVSTGLDVTVAINDTTEGREEESPCQFLRTRLLIDDDLKPDSNAS